MRNLQELLSRKQREYGDKFDASDLNPAFSQYFETGQRIKALVYGEPVTGTVGITTGWKPVFLLMRRSNAVRSSYCLGKEAAPIAIKRGRTYQPI